MNIFGKIKTFYVNVCRKVGERVYSFYKKQDDERRLDPSYFYGKKEVNNLIFWTFFLALVIISACIYF